MTRQHFQHLSKGTPMIALTRNISDLGGILSAFDVVKPAIDGIVRDLSIDTDGKAPLCQVKNMTTLETMVFGKHQSQLRKRKCA